MTERDTLILAHAGVRDNTILEDIHAGISPISKKGDYSDVKVIDGTGREISWAQVSRISNEEMETLMKSVVNNIYTLGKLLETHNGGPMEAMLIPSEWDRPVFDIKLAEAIVRLGAMVPK